LSGIFIGLEATYREEKKRKGEEGELNMNLDWPQAFRSWPNTTPGWRNWFRKVAGIYRAIWEQYDIGQCLNLSLSKMVKNEPLLTSASFY